MPLNALFGISAAGQAVTLLCAILLPRLDGVVAPAAPRVAEPATACVQKLVSADLLQSLTRRAVLWWTVFVRTFGRGVVPMEDVFGSSTPGRPRTYCGLTPDRPGSCLSASLMISQIPGR